MAAEKRARPGGGDGGAGARAACAGCGRLVGESCACAWRSQVDEVYLMWGDDHQATAKTSSGLTYIPAPKPKLPGHEESYRCGGGVLCLRVPQARAHDAGHGARYALRRPPPEYVGLEEPGTSAGDEVRHQPRAAPRAPRTGGHRRGPALTRRRPRSSHVGVRARGRLRLRTGVTPEVVPKARPEGAWPWRFSRPYPM